MASIEHVVVARTRAGTEREHEYFAGEPLAPGDVLFLSGRYWLVERVEPGGEDAQARAFVKPARYRLSLVHPEGREETGAFRRFGPDAPRLGHSFTTVEDGALVGWEVVDEQPAVDDEGEPYLALRAERDFAELEGDLPDHELEHARELRFPEEAAALFARADDAGLLVELVALEPGEEPDWDAAVSYIDALILEEIEDDLFELCGVDTRHDAQEKWLSLVQERLRSDLEQFRGDIEGDLDEIEEWDFRGGRIFASTGTHDDESDPLSGHGWLCRLVDAGAAAAAGFARIRKAELDVVG